MHDSFIFRYFVVLNVSPEVSYFYKKCFYSRGGQVGGRALPHSPPGTNMFVGNAGCVRRIVRRESREHIRCSSFVARTSEHCRARKTKKGKPPSLPSPFSDRCCGGVGGSSCPIGCVRCGVVTLEKCPDQCEQISFH